MKNIAAILGAVILAAGTAQAASYNSGNSDADMPAAPVVAAQTVEVKAADLMNKKDLERAGIDANATLSVSDFTAPGPRSTYIR